MDGLVQNEHATKKLQVVINRYSSHEAVTIEQIERAVHLPIAFKIPNSYGELVRSINIGEPVSSDSKSDFSAADDEMGSCARRGDCARGSGNGKEAVCVMEVKQPLTFTGRGFPYG